MASFDTRGEGVSLPRCFHSLSRCQRPGWAEANPRIDRTEVREILVGEVRFEPTHLTDGVYSPAHLSNCAAPPWSFCPSGPVLHFDDPNVVEVIGYVNNYFRE